MKWGLMATAAAAAATMVAGKQSVEICTDSLNDFGIEDVKLPEVVMAGERVEIEFSQKPNQFVGKGLVRVELTVEGIKVAFDVHELCKVTDCHSAAHTASRSVLSLAIPAFVPKGFDVSLKVIVSDHNGKLLSCVDVDGIKVGKKTQPGVLRMSAASNEDLSLSTPELEFLFKQWAAEYGHKFEDVAHRMKTFAANLEHIAEHNAGDHTYKLGMNAFGHLSQEEFAATHFGFNAPESMPEKSAEARQFYQLDVDELGLTDLPDEVDWTKKGAVTPVKNQGACGSCWSFSATGALEGAYFLKTGKLVSFSEQELVSCDHVDQGCNGGLMDNADRWIMKNGGLCAEEDYPYVSGAGRAPHTCKKDGCTSVEGSAPTKFVDVQHTEGSLEEAVAKQPVSVAIEADQMSFQFYKKGVLTGKCGAMLDHGVLAVGYGTLDGTKYWKVKNSWSPSYGMNGYVLIERGKSQRGGECGILQSASYPVL
ncbi:Senescence-specific cysteine protease SAG39 (Cysteine proteinase SAG39) (Protein SENESCENCE-ASSOCIATED GENE 39) [Durusdinium trenchii]|uniref:Senescence-specific cysteine protease SAG39 (Cysteine proteinase SAG39) (Protein SENESCENCE-ASSOCIATED GENE 39) n=1 Tax=Durusdinium trenchii TaxID=1381693 RepID=A0ABP0LE29_9DINO